MQSVKDFSTMINTYYASIDAVQGRYIVDAKSILGLYSLNLLEPITIQVYKGDLTKDEETELDNFLLPYEVQKV